MNERIREISNRAWSWAEQQEYTDPTKEFSDILEQKFAELLIRECAGIVNENDFEGSSLGDRLLFEHFGVSKRNDDLETDDPIKNRDSLMKSVDKLRALSKCDGEEPRGWVCPKCGIDRIKEACPNGHHAALTGQCPMVGIAL